MALQAPVLPQQINGIITTDQLTDDGGARVIIPRYDNIAVGDKIRLYWDNFLALDYTIENTYDLPKEFKIAVSYTRIGNNSVYYTSTDFSNNTNTSSVVNITINQSPAILTSQIIINDAVAGDPTGNFILYTLTTTSRRPIANIYLLFTATGNATLNPEYGLTDASGQFSLRIRSATAIGVQVTATSSTPIQQKNITTVNFVAAAPNYQINTVVMNNDAPADDIATITIQARLINTNTGQGIANQYLVIIAAATATYHSPVATDAQGYCLIPLASRAVGNLNVNIVMYSNPAIQTNRVINFTVSYPTLLDKHPVYLSGNIGIQTFLKPFRILVGHHYRIISTRTPNSVENCSNNSSFNQGTNTCGINQGRYYTFLGPTMNDVVAIATGAGAELTSERYNTYTGTNIGDAEIEVFDYGPYYSTRLTETLNNALPDEAAMLINPTDSSVLVTPLESSETVAPVNKALADESFELQGAKKPIAPDI